MRGNRRTALPNVTPARDMTFNIFLVVCGFAVLVFGADMLVRGASRLASAAAAPALVSGLTIVAFGSMPIMESPIR